MANVFGNPITDATLKAMVEFADRDFIEDPVTSSDRARVALNMQNANMRDKKGRSYVENLKQQSGTGVSTLCLIYNATGNTLTFTSSKDWYGHIGQAPYPIRIQNGQWGAFLHVKSSTEATGSCSAAVFRGKDGIERKDDKGGIVINDCDYMMAWSSPWRRVALDNSVWAEAQEVNYFNNAKWDEIYRMLRQTRYISHHTWNGCSSTIAIGSDTSPVLEAVFTLENAAN